MFYKSKPHFEGLDHSGPSKVLPPTFQGIKALVERYGPEQAAMMFPETDASPDEVQEFIHDFWDSWSQADKVERETLAREFTSYVKDLKLSSQEDPEQEPPGGTANPEPPAQVQPDPGSTSKTA